MSIRLHLGCLRRLIALFTWDARDRDMDQEMAFHVESMTRDYVRCGHERGGGERAARRRFGSVTAPQGSKATTSELPAGRERRAGRQAHGPRPAAKPGLRHRGDPHAGARHRRQHRDLLGRRSAPAAAAAIPERRSAADDLRVAYDLATGTRRQTATPSRRPTGSTGNARVERCRDWPRGATIAMTLTGVGEPTASERAARVLGVLPLLGVTPLLGRTVSEQDDRPNAPRVAVLSHELWQRRSAVIPKVDRPCRAVQRSAGRRSSASCPPAFGSCIRTTTCGPRCGSTGPSRGARRKDGSSTWSPGSRRERRSRPREPRWKSLAATAGRDVRLQQEHVGDAGPVARGTDRPGSHSLLVLYAAVACCCRSPASMSPTCCWRAPLRAAGRSPSAHRWAPGRLAIIRQLLVESLLLAVAGGALGIALARWSLDALMAFAPADLLRVPELSRRSARPAVRARPVGVDRSGRRTRAGGTGRAPLDCRRRCGRAGRP